LHVKEKKRRLSISLSILRGSVADWWQTSFLFSIPHLQDMDSGRPGQQVKGLAMMKWKKKTGSGKRLGFFLAAFMVWVPVSGCLLPKEEELVTTPVIEAYEHDDFKTTTVKRGDLIDEQKVDCTVLGINEKALSFGVEDKSYRGVYVKAGEQVEANTVVAELVSDGLTANLASLKLRAPFSGLVTYALEVQEGEKSVINKRVVIINNGSAYYLIAQTQYWETFQAGDVYTITIAGKSYEATVVEPEEVGVERLAHTGEEAEVYPVYFKIADMSACLYSDLRGTISITLGEKKDVLYVPASAVTTVNGKVIVYYEDEDGVRNIKEVETGLEANGKIEIVSGLSEGDVIILE
jgi:hypothetical protein